MKVNKIQGAIMSVCLLGMMATMVSCAGGTVLTDLFNPEFVTDTGLKPGPDEQITPDLSTYLWLKVTNQTNYSAQITVAIKRAQDYETFSTVVMANQTIGKLIEGCNSETNPVLNLFIPNLGSAETGSAIPVAQVLVTVEGVPVVVPSSQLPGILNVRTDFNCGDTVEFVIHNSFDDPDRFRVSALIYNGTTE